MHKEVNQKSYIDGCSEYTSEIGSYSCSSNLERSSFRQCNKARTKLAYPGQLIVMRHSERIDQLLPEWYNKCQKDGGEYRVYDVNMPPRLPLSRPLCLYNNDSALTVTGDILARLVGRGIAVGGYDPDVIYCSPALRCIQTATAVRSMCKTKPLIRVEPGFFENAWLYPDGRPILSSPSERKVFPVDPEYRPFVSFESIFEPSPEDMNDYNRRISSTFQRILKTTEVSEKKDLTVLVVGHASTVDMAVGLLRSRPRPSTFEDLIEIAQNVPYCSNILLEREQGERGWVPNPYAIPHVNHQDLTTAFNPRFVNRS